MFRPCLQLRLFANAVCAADPPDLRYVDFWRDFPADEDSSIRTMYRALFGGIGLRKPVAIWSVFSDHHQPHDFPYAELRGDDYVHVASSGEAHYLDLARYDLNLIMAPEDPPHNVVPFLNFAANAHEFGLWPLLSARGPMYPGKKFCVAVISNEKGTVRNRFLERLHARKLVDSCGRWMNTAGFVAPRDDGDHGALYYPFLQQYKFMVCFENTRRTHYITEKLANAYAAGCIPIYWGAPEASSWLNPKAFLSLDSESDDAMDALIARVLELDADEGAYARMYREPLIAGAIPDLMRIETLREKVASTLRRSRPDAF